VTASATLFLGRPLRLTRVRTFHETALEETEIMTKLPFTLAAAAVSFAFAGSAFAGPAEDIIAKEKCGNCHTAQTTKKAPSWASIAQKMKGDPAAEAKIVEFLKTGGTEDHKKVAASDADLKAIAQIVLSSK
jgi:cytochrome c551/c552